MALKERNSENSIQGFTRRDFLKRAVQLTQASIGISLFGCDTPRQPQPTRGETLYTNYVKTTEGEHVYNIDIDIPDESSKEIRDHVKVVYQWFLENNIPIGGGVSVFAFNNPDRVINQYFYKSSIPPDRWEIERGNLKYATAWVGFSRDIYIITSSPGWTRASPIIGGPAKEGRIHTITHELFHITQRELGAYNRPPVAWINEGSAHYIAAVMLGENKIYDYQNIRARHIPEAVKVKEPLSQLESNETFYTAGNPATADEFSLAFLAVEFAARGLPGRGVDALVDFWKKVGQGSKFPEAFEQAFGKKLTQFYTEFELYRKEGFKTP